MPSTPAIGWFVISTPGRPETKKQNGEDEKTKHTAENPRTRHSSRGGKQVIREERTRVRRGLVGEAPRGEGVAANVGDL